MSDYDEIRQSYRAIVRGAIPNIDFFAYYRAQVMAQSLDGSTVDVQPDDQRLPACSMIPLRLGLPGVTVTVQPGCFVMLGWDGGDPSKPFATLWDLGGTLLNIKITAGNASPAATFEMNPVGFPGCISLNGGVRPVACVGDTAGPYPITGSNITVLAP